MTEAAPITTSTVAKLDAGVPFPSRRMCRLGDLRALVAHVEGLSDDASIFLRREDGTTADARTIEVST